PPVRDAAGGPIAVGGGCCAARDALHPRSMQMPAPQTAARPVAITLPDGKTLDFPGAVTGTEIAARIGPGLAKAALAMTVDGAPRDLAAAIERDARVAIITRDSPEGLEILRHDAAHVLAEAA